MKNIWKNYKQTIILLVSILIGGIVGCIFKEKAQVLNPLGELFMNMMFVLIVPLIFLTITTSIAKIKSTKRLSKLLGTIIGVFVITSTIALLVGILSTYTFKLVKTESYQTIMENVETVESTSSELNLLERTVAAISTNDFYKILSRDNLIVLVLFSLCVGIAMHKIGEKSRALEEVLQSANAVVLKLVDMAYFYAPIGLGCYFASLIGTIGTSIATGFLKTFILYTVIAILFYIIVYSLYAYLAGGKKAVITYWKNVLPASITSISTCSSAASIPINIKCVKNMGVPNDIAETTVPLGTSFHKDGSIIGSVFKIMFLAYLFGMDIYSAANIGKIVATAFIANLLVSAVPIGGGTISEMMIITMMGFPIASLPILTIIATIIDAPATLLNVVGDTSSSLLITRFIEGKNWLTKKKKES